MKIYAISYQKYVDEEKKDFTEIYEEKDFPAFFNKAIFYQGYPFEYDNLKLYHGNLKEIELTKNIKPEVKEKKA